MLYCDTIVSDEGEGWYLLKRLNPLHLFAPVLSHLHHKYIYKRQNDQYSDGARNIESTLFQTTNIWLDQDPILE